MSITISRNDLKEAIASLSKVINKHPSLPVLSAVSISSSITGLKITATNLNEYLSCNIKGKSDYPTAVIVSLPELKEYLEYSKSASIYTLTKTHISDARISSDIEEHKEKVLRCFPEGEWPDMPDISKDKSNPITKEALKNIQSVIPSALKEGVREALKCVLIDGKSVVVSNGVQLVKLDCDTGINEQALVQASRFMASSVFAEMDSSISILKFNDQKYLSISNQNWEYSIKLSNETYPDYRQVLPKETSHSFEILNGDIARLQAEIPLMATITEHKVIHLYMNESHLMVLPEGISGKHIQIPINSTGFCNSKVIVKSMNKDLLLRAFSLGFNKFSFNEGNSPIIASNKNDSFMAFMPLKENPETIKLIEQAMSSNLSPQPNIPITKPKEESKMEEKTNTTTNYAPTFQGSDIKTDPMEELINKISTVRTKAREIIDITIDVSNQLRNMQKASRTKERDFKSANELLEKLKKVSGF